MTTPECRWRYVLQNIEKLSLAKKYHVAFLISVFHDDDPDILKQNNNGVWVRRSELSDSTINKIYEYIKLKIENNI